MAVELGPYVLAHVDPKSFVAPEERDTARAMSRENVETVRRSFEVWKRG
jgi:hypothetical protein